MLKNDYVDSLLDTTKNTTKVFDIVDEDNTVLYSNVHLVEKTVYSQVGSFVNANGMNAIANSVNGLSKVLSKVVLKDAKTVTFTDSSIKSTSMLQLFVSDLLVAPETVTATTGSVTYTFDALPKNAEFKLRVINIEEA